MSSIIIGIDKTHSVNKKIKGLCNLYLAKTKQFKSFSASRKCLDVLFVCSSYRVPGYVHTAPNYAVVPALR